MIWCPLLSEELLSCDLWPPTNQWSLPTRVRLFANPPSQGILILRQPSNTSTNTNKQDTTRACQNVYQRTHTQVSVHGNTDSDAPCSAASNTEGKGKAAAVENYNSKLARSEIALCGKNSSPWWRQGGKTCWSKNHVVKCWQHTTLEKAVAFVDEYKTVKAKNTHAPPH